LDRKSSTSLVTYTIALQAKQDGHLQEKNVFADLAIAVHIALTHCARPLLSLSFHVFAAFMRD